jgi:hypothetical protein
MIIHGILKNLVSESKICSIKWSNLFPMDKLIGFISKSCQASWCNGESIDYIHVVRNHDYYILFMYYDNYMEEIFPSS